MKYVLHDTAHLEKRAREREFSIEQATLAVNEPRSILKTPPRKGNQAQKRGRSVILAHRRHEPITRFIMED